MKELKNERTKDHMLVSQFDERLFFYEPDVRGKKELIHLCVGNLRNMDIVMETMKN